MPSLVSIIVLNWNGRAYLETCLTALAGQNYPTFEIIVVDNGSSDGSVAWLAEHYPTVRIISNLENRGFAAGNNQGIQAARGEYIALLNNDTQVAPDWLAQLVRGLEVDPRCGMVASRMVFADNPEVINSTGICVDRSGISWDREGGQPVAHTECNPMAIFGACAGAALYRRALFDDIGVFDEDFFAYLEDVDLAWRAQWRGWKAFSTPTALVLHHHSATTGDGSPFKTYLLSQNKIQLLVKNYPWPHMLLFWPLVLFYELTSLAFAIVQGRGVSAWQGRLAGLRRLPQAWAKRHVLSPLCSGAEIWARLEPAGWPWQVYRRYQHLPAQKL